MNSPRPLETYAQALAYINSLSTRAPKIMHENALRRVEEAARREKIAPWFALTQA